MFSEHHATGILPDNMSIIICSKYNFLCCTSGCLVADIFLCPFIALDLCRNQCNYTTAFKKQDVSFGHTYAPN